MHYDLEFMHVWCESKINERVQLDGTNGFNEAKHDCERETNSVRKKDSGLFYRELDRSSRLYQLHHFKQGY